MLGFALPIAALVAQSSTPAPVMPAFLTGCWTSEVGEEWTEECWMEPRGGIMLGAARSGIGARLKDWESTRIEQGADGRLTFSASVKGGPAVTFVAVTQSGEEVVFANPQHDYPQRVRYWKSDKTLNAEISLSDGSKAVRWSYRPDR